MGLARLGRDGSDGVAIGEFLFDTDLLFFWKATSLKRLT